MRHLVTVRRLLEEEGLDPDTTYVDPDDVATLETDEDEEED